MNEENIQFGPSGEEFHTSMDLGAQSIDTYTLPTGYTPAPEPEAVPAQALDGSELTDELLTASLSGNVSTGPVEREVDYAIKRFIDSTRTEVDTANLSLRLRQLRGDANEKLQEKINAIISKIQ